MTVAERRKEEREERRNLILDAAERVFHHKGLDAATMEDVASEARLGKGTLYLYFRNKDDLRLAMTSRRQEALLQSMAAAHADARTGLDELRRLLLAYAQHLSSPIEHLQMVLSCWVSGTHFHDGLPAAAEHLGLVRRTFSMFCEAIERGRLDGTVRGGPPAPRVALQLWSAVNGALLLQLQIAHMSRDRSLSAVSPGLPPPSVEESIDACLDAVRLRTHEASVEPGADSTPEPPAVVVTDAADEPLSEPRAAAAGDDPEGGVQC